MKKILICGAGVGGLELAYELGKSEDYEVMVFEKNAYDKLTYDWHDDIEANIFKEMDLPFPDAKYYHPKKDWAFVAPFNRGVIKLPKSPNPDVSMTRRPFSHEMIKRANKAEFLFEITVLAPITEGNAVIGVKTDKGDFFGDLTVDCLGVDSVLRRNLPKSFGIENELLPEQLFCAYRGFYVRNDVPAEEVRNKAYLKHLGNKGISWCIDRGDSVDILIGKTGTIDKEYIDTALADLRATNACLGKELQRQDGVYHIPVRYPLTNTVADGYVLLGDSAAMTIPVMGSGMASSIRSGKLLSDLLKTLKPPYKTADLWAYEVSIYELFGTEHCGIDGMKRWLLATSSEDLVFLFCSGFMEDKDFAAVSGGGELKMGLTDYLKKLKIGIKRLPLVLNLVKTLKRMEKVKTIAATIPKTYDKKAIAEWSRSLDTELRKFDV